MLNNTVVMPFRTSYLVPAGHDVQLDDPVDAA